MPSRPRVVIVVMAGGTFTASEQLGHAGHAQHRFGPVRVRRRTTRTVPAITVSTAIDGAGNAIAVFGSSYTWHLAAWPT